MTAGLRCCWPANFRATLVSAKPLANSRPGIRTTAKKLKERTMTSTINPFDESRGTKVLATREFMNQTLRCNLLGLMVLVIVFAFSFVAVVLIPGLELASGLA